MMQRALADAGLDRGATQLALFERGRRQTPVAGKVIAVGLVDEITDRHYVIVDGADGRVHYAEIGRVSPHTVPSRGMLVSLASDSLQGQPRSVVRLKVLSAVGLEALPTYDGPTWLDRALTDTKSISIAPAGFGKVLNKALEDRRQWLVANGMADRTPAGDWVAQRDMRGKLQAREQARIVQALSRQLNASYLPHEFNTRVSGIYERSVATPNGRLAVIRREDTYTLAPWKAALEPLRGQAVTALLGHRVVWSLDRGRGLPGRA